MNQLLAHMLTVVPVMMAVTFGGGIAVGVYLGRQLVKIEADDPYDVDRVHREKQW